MFDISFTELMVVGAVALIVIGPEKLPRVARTVGHLLGRVQRYVADVKSDINREMEFEELRRLRAEMTEAARTVEESVRAVESSARRQIDEVQSEFNDLGTAVQSTDSPASSESAPGQLENPVETAETAVLQGDSAADADPATRVSAGAPADNRHVADTSSAVTATEPVASASSAPAGVGDQTGVRDMPEAPAAPVTSDSPASTQKLPS